MKLPSITHGPVSLTKIEYSPRLSQETLAFAAVVTVNGVSAHVRNDGNGGCCMFSDWSVAEAIKAYCATLPPAKYGQEEFTYDVDFLLSTMVEMAQAKRAQARITDKGLEVLKGSR